MWRLFKKLKPLLSKLLNRFVVPPPPNLLGDRSVESSWIVANMPDGPGEALDFGSGQSYLGLAAARKEFSVTAIDLLPVRWYYQHPKLRFVQGDIFDLNFPDSHFDIIINCSSIEHVGLSGRYGVSESLPNGDIDAMKRLKELLKPGRLMLLTIPVGKDQVIGSQHRIYGIDRLPLLLDGWELIKEEFWAKDENNIWNSTDKTDAISRAPTDHYYNLGLFVLRRPE